MSAADQLQGLTLDGGWVVQKRLPHQPTTGGVFSVPYVVVDNDGKEHFLKALDFSRAFEPGRDTFRELENMTSIYNHERDILEHCKARGLSRVVVAVSHGYVQVPGFVIEAGRVSYLIFEMAESDVRRQVDAGNRIDCLSCLSILNDVTLGLMQLHREQIAHQDLKPSNVLTYGNDGCRVADFGRSSRRGRDIWVDELKIAGDPSYAPPEQQYSHTHGDFVVRRIGCDLYLLGNLAAFLFTGINMTAALFSRMDPALCPQNWAGTYEQVLPHLQRAFADAVADISASIDPLVRDQITTLVRELCNPDLSKRDIGKVSGAAANIRLNATNHTLIYC